MRICANGIIEYQGKYLICKMPQNKGVYPGQWAIPGGGIDPGETMEQALAREIWEEVGLKIHQIRPLLFSDEHKDKLKPNGTAEKIYMIFLVFTCQAQTNKVQINDEFEDYAWVSLDQIFNYDLNIATRNTFSELIKRKQAGLI